MAPPKQNGAAAEAEESPVVAVLQKRLRNLRKRLRNADEIQAKLESGKELNPDQVRGGNMPWCCKSAAAPPRRWGAPAHLAQPACRPRCRPSAGQAACPPSVACCKPLPRRSRHKRDFLPQELALSSKPGLLAAIEELEKMTAGLKEALKEELTVAAADARKNALAEAEAGALGCRVGGQAAVQGVQATERSGGRGGFSTQPEFAGRLGSLQCQSAAVAHALLSTKPTCLTLCAAAAKERAAVKGAAEWEKEKAAAVAAAKKAAKEEAAAAQVRSAAGCGCKGQGGGRPWPRAAASGPKQALQCGADAISPSIAT